jgi:Na+/H+ antiporter NhaC
MRPVTDRHQVSRAKLAYLIDATAAPVCIIAPISSWAAAVSAFSPEGTNGLVLFIKAIPYNYYALLTILMMVTITILKIDYGPMARHEKNALAGNIFTDMEAQVSDEDAVKGSGKVIDLILPIASLIICCVIGMIYSGGFFEGESFIDAFANSDASVGLVLGSFVALAITLIVYMLRGVLKFKDCMACLSEGFRAMVPAIMILVLAWTLKSMTDSLGAKDYVAAIVSNSAGALQNFLPSIVFLIAVGLSFATGTSWGTFGILIPICLASFPLESGNPLAIICVSACMAGAVCGDHCSPISDTTIMSSAGAMCDHIAHVSTQMPYALTVAAISFVVYVIAGFVQNPVVCLIIGVIITIGCMFFLHYGMKNKDTETA